jgi:hypothetical protein
MYFSETFRRTDELSARALRAHNGSHPKGRGKKAYIEFSDYDSWDYDTDRETLGTLLRNYRAKMPAGEEWLDAVKRYERDVLAKR